MSKIIEVNFFNAYWLKSIKASNADTIPGFPKAHPGIAYPGGLASGYSLRNYYIEEGRIRGGFNNTFTDNGVRAYLDEQYPLQQDRINTLIYSGVYNSRTGINQTNVFSVAEELTRSLDPSYGSIQKTYSEDTNLIVFQENKISRALIDKDTIYTTEGGTQTQAAATVIGQFVPYKGEYGISKNPESFAIYNYRKYFSDKNRNSIMRLSNDGLTEISMYGMMDYFRDNMAEVSENFQTHNVPGTVAGGGGTGTTAAEITISSSGIKPSVGMTISGQSGGYITNVIENSETSITIFYSKLFSPAIVGSINFQFKTRGRIIGGFDIHNKNYVLSLQKTPNQISTTSDYKTLTFDEQINGWVSFLTFKPNHLFSVLNKTYTTRNIELFQQYDTSVVNNRGIFYGVQSPSNITFVFNPNPSVVKNFKTINYEGSNGWEVKSFVSGFEGFDPDPQNTGQYMQNQDTTMPTPPGVSVKSYDEGLYTDVYTGQPLRAGFNRKENKYVSNLISNSVARPGEIIFGAAMTGIKGYFATVKIETDATTQLGGAKELWSAGSSYVTSSY